MANLRPIPSPPGQIWREFRYRVGPFLAFAAMLGLAALTWKNFVAPGSILGEVENNKVDLISTLSGQLVELNVDRFETVTKGQLVGRFYSVEPEQLKASLLALQMDLRVMRARIALDERRNEMNYESLRLDCLNQKAELAIARTEYNQAVEQFKRTQRLFADKVASQMELDVAERDQQRLFATLEEKTRIVAALEETLERLGPALKTGEPADPQAELITQTIAAEENRLMLLEGPIELRAPEDGVISAVSCRPGQKIMAGMPIVTISAPAKRIVGYIRQPVHVVPRTGTKVQIRTRGSQHKVALGEVLKVGRDMQYVTSPMRVRGFDNAMERGLPFLVSLPPGLEVVPGELVDLILMD